MENPGGDGESEDATTLVSKKGKEIIYLRLRTFLNRKAATSGGRMQAVYVIKPGSFELTEHYIRKSLTYFNNLLLTKNISHLYNVNC